VYRPDPFCTITVISNGTQFCVSGCSLRSPCNVWFKACAAK